MKDNRLPYIVVILFCLFFAIKVVAPALLIKLNSQTIEMVADIETEEKKQSFQQEWEPELYFPYNHFATINQPQKQTFSKSTIVKNTFYKQTIIINITTPPPEV